MRQVWTFSFTPLTTCNLQRHIHVQTWMYKNTHLTQTAALQLCLQPQRKKERYIIEKETPFREDWHFSDYYCKNSLYWGYYWRLLLKKMRWKQNFTQFCEINFITSYSDKNACWIYTQCILFIYKKASWHCIDGNHQHVIHCLPAAHSISTYWVIKCYTKTLVGPKAKRALWVSGV